MTTLAPGNRFRLWPTTWRLVRSLVLSALPVPDLLSRLKVRRAARDLARGCDPWPGMAASGDDAARLALHRLLYLQRATHRAVRSRQDEAATMLARVIDQAGLPSGAFNLVHGHGPGAAGEFLTGHPGVDAIAFTGESATGSAIMRSAADHVTPVSFELGGKNPALVFADADLDAAVDGTVRSSFTHSGQICLCTERVYVERPVFDEFVERLGARARELSDYGPMISAAHRDKVLSYYQLAREEGATVVAGGGAPSFGDERDGGFHVEPTVLTGLPETARTVREEIFGPVCHVAPFDTEDEALRLANDSPYGLASTVWTRDLSRAHRVAPKVETGIVWVNCWNLRDLRTPFGGVRLVDEVEERALGVGGSGALEQVGQGAVGEDRAVPHEDEPVAADRLVHDVAGHQQARAAVPQPVEEVPEVPPQHRVEPDRRLVEHEEVRPSQQRDRERHAGELAAGQRAHDPLLEAREVDVPEGGAHALVVHPQDRRRVAQVLGDGEVGVHARRLRGVADTAPERRRARRLAEHLDRATRHDLGSDDGAHQRGLAAAARAEQPDDLAGGHREVQPLDDVVPAADDSQPADRDRRDLTIPHARNNGPAARSAQGPPATRVRARARPGARSGTGRAWARRRPRPGRSAATPPAPSG